MKTLSKFLLAISTALFILFEGCMGLIELLAPDNEVPPVAWWKTALFTLLLLGVLLGLPCLVWGWKNVLWTLATLALLGGIGLIIRAMLRNKSSTL